MYGVKYSGEKVGSKKMIEEMRGRIKRGNSYPYNIFIFFKGEINI